MKGDYQATYVWISLCPREQLRQMYWTSTQLILCMKLYYSVLAGMCLT